MKILVACRVYPTHLIGGMPVAARWHAIALARRGHDVTFATTVCNGRAAWEADSGVRVAYLPNTTPLTMNEEFESGLRAFAETTGPYDVVLSESTCARSLIGRYPTVLWLHGYALEIALNNLGQFEDSGNTDHLEVAKAHFIGGFGERELFRRFAAVVALSTGCERDLRHKLFLSNVHQIHNAIDIEAFQPDRSRRGSTRHLLNIDADRPVILTACHLQRIKGVHHLIAQLPQVKHDALLVVAGTGPERESLEALATSVGVSDRVRFLGDIQYADMPDLCRMADVFFSGSYHYSGLDMNVVEAAACGCPIVGCDAAGKSDILKHRDTGLAYTLAGRRFLSDYINFVLAPENSDLVLQQVNRALSVAAHKFGLDTLGERMDALFSEILGG